MLKTLRVLVCLFIITAVGCAKVEIDSPIQDDVYLDTPDIFSFHWPDTTLLHLSFNAYLNGTNVTDLFTVNPLDAWATGEDLMPYLKHGTNVFSVMTSSLTVVQFEMDFEAPEVHIVSVIDEGGVFSVDGYLDDPTGADTLELKYTLSNTGSTPYFLDVPIEGDQFSLSIPSNHLAKGKPTSFDFLATDFAGQSKTTHFDRRYLTETKQVTFDDSMVLKVSRDGLDFVGEVAPSVLALIDPIELLKNDGEPIVDTNYLGLDTRIKVLDGEAEFDNLQIDLSATPNMDLDLNIDTVLTELEFQLCIQLLPFRIYIPFIIDVTIPFPEVCFLPAEATTTAHIFAAMDVSATDEGIIEVGSLDPLISVSELSLDFGVVEDIVKGIIKAPIQVVLWPVDALLSLAGLSIGPVVDGFVDDVWDWTKTKVLTALAQAVLGIDYVIELIFGESLLWLIVDQAVEPAIATVLGNVPLGLHIPLDIEGQPPKSINVAAGFHDIHREGETLVVQLNTSSEVPTPYGVPDPLGVRSTGVAANPGMESRDHFGISISTTMLNQILDSTYQAGFFSMLIQEPPTEENAGIELELYPGSAPFIVTTNNLATPTALNEMGRLKLYDMMIIARRIETNEERTLLFSTSINLDVPFNLIVPEGTQNLGLEITDYTDIEVVAAEFNAPVYPSERTTQQIVNVIESMVTTPLASLVADILGAVPLPSLAGLSLTPTNITQQGNSIVVSGEFLEVE